jgi:radical SAM protein with 4Fe4S-binding SPASM domain
MMRLRSPLAGIFGRPKSTPAPAPLLRRFEVQDRSGHSTLHLRLDPDGAGLLLINASRVLHLNPSAALMAEGLLEAAPAPQIVKRLTRRFRVDAAQARADLAAFEIQWQELIRPDGGCPFHDLGAGEPDSMLLSLPPFAQEPAAPYRMDLALTYRCNNACPHCYNARPRTFPELDTAGWKEVLDRCWAAGIPHVVFTGGEPTLRPDLPELIAYAQSLGQLTGLNTNGRRLADPTFVDTLVAAGLDHVQITFESHDPAIHDAMVHHAGAWEQTVAGLRNVLTSRLFVMTNTTLLQANAPHLAATLDYLAQLDVPTIGLNALIHSGRGATVGTGLDEGELPPLLELARAATSAHDQRLIWYTPTDYCRFDPMQLELGVKACTAARYNLCVEPDGAVLPCQSYYTPLGNLLTDSWDAIWNHELALKLRHRTDLRPACRSCGLLNECGGGCPLAPHIATPPPTPFP